MTRKDYEAIASALAGSIIAPRDSYDEGFNDGIEHAVTVFEKDNPRFDVDRFLMAVGITP